MSLFDIVESPYLIPWLPTICLGALFLLSAYYYADRSDLKDSAVLVKNFKRMIRAALVFYILYPLLLTAGQYYVWLQNPLTKILANSPVSAATPLPQILKNSPIFQGHLGYLLFYAYGRFWINSLLAAGMAFLFSLFLKSLRRHRDRFFEEGEVELGFLSALVVGWPNFAIFVPAIFFLVVIISIVRMAVWKEHYTTLGYPFLAAALFTLLFGAKMIALFHLTVLII